MERKLPLLAVRRKNTYSHLNVIARSESETIQLSFLPPDGLLP
jgi:hypothetical protein